MTFEQAYREIDEDLERLLEQPKKLIKVSVWTTWVNKVNCILQRIHKHPAETETKCSCDLPGCDCSYRGTMKNICMFKD